MLYQCGSLSLSLSLAPLSFSHSSLTTLAHQSTDFDRTPLLTAERWGVSEWRASFTRAHALPRECKVERSSSSVNEEATAVARQTSSPSSRLTSFWQIPLVFFCDSPYTPASSSSSSSSPSPPPPSSTTVFCFFFFFGYCVCFLRPPSSRKRKSALT